MATAGANCTITERQALAVMAVAGGLSHGGQGYARAEWRADVDALLNQIRRSKNEAVAAGFTRVNVEGMGHPTASPSSR